MTGHVTSQVDTGCGRLIPWGWYCLIELVLHTWWMYSAFVYKPLGAQYWPCIICAWHITLQTLCVLLKLTVCPDDKYCGSCHVTESCWQQQWTLLRNTVGQVNYFIRLWCIRQMLCWQLHWVPLTKTVVLVPKCDSL